MQRFVVITLTLFCLFASCKKADPIIQPTQLEITIVDELLEPVEGGLVTLYNSENDLKNLTNAIKSVTSDAKGKTLFNVEPQTYFWWVQGKGCSNNQKTSVSSTTSMTANILNVGQVQVQKYGTILLENNSTNRYRVEVDGTFVGDIVGKSSLENKYAKLGSHSVRVTQLDGFVLTPTIKSYSITIAECDNKRVLFPF